MKNKNPPLIFLILTCLSIGLIFLLARYYSSGSRATGGGLGRSRELAWLFIYSLAIPILLALTGWIVGAVSLTKEHTKGKLIATIINALIFLAIIFLLIWNFASA